MSTVLQTNIDYAAVCDGATSFYLSNIDPFVFRQLHIYA